jgi:hypothetical protein
VCVEQHVLRLHAFADPIDVFGPAPADVIGAGRVLASATDPAGDAAGAADVVGVSLLQLADAIDVTVELAAPLDQVGGFGGYRVALAAPNRPLRYALIGLDRRAFLADEDLIHVASLGGVHVSGTTMRMRVPLELLGDPTSLAWSLSSQVGLGSDAVAGSTVSLARVRDAAVALAPSESLTIHAGVLPGSGVSYAMRWTVDGAPRGDGASLTLRGSDLGPGRHVVVFEATGTTSSVRRDADGLLGSRRELAVVVGDVAGRPTAAAGPDVAVARGAAVTLDGTASAGEAPALTWRQIAGPPVALDDPHAARPGFAAPRRNALLAFQLVVADGATIGLPDVVYVAVGSVPSIAAVAVKNNRKLVVNGSGFGAGAVIEIDGTAVSDTKAPRAGTRLASKRALEIVPVGSEVTVTVRNADGLRSVPFSFVR